MSNISNQALQGVLALTQEFDNLLKDHNQNLAFLKTLVSGLRDGSITVDQVEVTENGGMRINTGEKSKSAVAEAES